jgi:hypothetical protein
VSALAVILVFSVFVDPDFALAQPDEDSVMIESIRINGALGMNQSVTDAIRLLGNPDHRKDFESLAFGPMTELYYGQSRIAFIDGVLQEFEIRDSRLFLTLPAGIVSIGDDSAYLSELFPQAFSDKVYSERLGMYTMAIPITDVLNGNSIVLDISIEIAIDMNGKVVYILLEQLV